MAKAIYQAVSPPLDGTPLVNIVIRDLQPLSVKREAEGPDRSNFIESHSLPFINFLTAILGFFP
jgi:hypothetical protein